MRNVATYAATLTVAGAAPGQPTVTASAAFTDVVDAGVRAVGVPVVLAGATVSVTGLSDSAGFVQSGPATGTFSGTGVLAKIRSKNIVCEGDEVLVQVPATNPNSGATATIPVLVKVASAQKKVRLK